MKPADALRLQAAEVRVYLVTHGIPADKGVIFITKQDEAVLLAENKPAIGFTRLFGLKLYVI